jgi:hypothetical protein
MRYGRWSKAHGIDDREMTRYLFHIRQRTPILTSPEVIAALMSESTLRELLQICIRNLWDLNTKKEMESMADHLLRSVLSKTIVTASNPD